MSIRHLQGKWGILFHQENGRIVYHISFNYNLKNLFGYRGTHAQVMPLSKMPAVETVARVKSRVRVALKFC